MSTEHQRPTLDSRPAIHDARTAIHEREFARDVRRDPAMTPKQLQSKYLYDALGSSLFEAICRLPWYRITTAERRLLEQHARAIVRSIWQKADTVPLIVELGCGSGEKIVILAEALQETG